MKFIKLHRRKSVKLLPLLIFYQTGRLVRPLHCVNTIDSISLSLIYLFIGTLHSYLEQTALADICVFLCKHIFLALLSYSHKLILGAFGEIQELVGSYQYMQNAQCLDDLTLTGNIIKFSFLLSISVI